MENPNESLNGNQNQNQNQKQKQKQNQDGIRKIKTPSLLEACEQRNIELIKTILMNTTSINDFDLNECNEMKETPIHICCRNGLKEIVKMMIHDERVDVNRLNKFNETPFYIACKNNQSEIVLLMMKHPRVDIVSTNISGFSPFFISCQEGYKHQVKLFMKDSRIDVNQKTPRLTPFFVACSQGHTEIVKDFIKNVNFKSINVTDQRENTPFLIACKKGHFEIAQILFKDDRVNINKPNVDGLTALIFAISHNHISIVRLLIKDLRKLDASYETTKDWLFPDFETRMIFKGSTAIDVATELKRNEIISILPPSKNFIVLSDQDKTNWDHLYEYYLTCCSYGCIEEVQGLFKMKKQFRKKMKPYFNISLLK